MEKFIMEKLGHYEDRSVSKIATLLDPRYKKRPYSTDTSAEKAVAVLTKLLTVEIQKNAAKNRSSNVSNESKVQRSKTFAFMDNADSPTSLNPEAESINLLHSYFSFALEPENSNPLGYLQNRFPELFSIELNYFCTPGSSTSVKRLFSLSGLISDDRRSRLTGKNINIICFLNKNL